MPAKRQDAWTKEEDNQLAAIVISSIREGRTQLSVFEEMAQQIDRSAAACGFRWNSEVRKHYKTEIEEAKKERAKLKEKPRASVAAIEAVKRREVDVELDYIEVIVEAARKQKVQTLNLTRQIGQLTKENKELQKKVQILEQEVQNLRKVNQESALQEDYKALIKILQRAREMGFIHGDHDRVAAFRMDPNGNLEQIG
jgi:prespore-specific regulator